MLNNKSILITGGTGSFGQAFVDYVLKTWPDVKRLVIYSRDEQKQFQMEQQYPSSRYKAMRYFIGQVRNCLVDGFRRKITEQPPFIYI